MIRKARYSTISIKDDYDKDHYVITFYTMPGMGTAVGELTAGDLSDLYELIGDQLTEIADKEMSG